MLINMKQLLTVAKENQFAVGAFNVADSNFLRVVIEAAEENDAPAIIAVHPTELAFTKDEFFHYAVSRAKNSSVPIVIHMDHGDSLASIMRAIHCGFSSVMIDGSLLPFEENIALTKQITEICHPIGVSVEGELGTIGNTGTSVEGGVSEVIYTRPEDAQEFIEKTKMDVLQEIKDRVDIPLVLHGGSANPDEEIAQAVAIGIQKVNISSDYKYAFYKKCRQILAETELWDPNAIYPECIEAAKAVVTQKMTLFNAIGKAALYRQQNVQPWRSEQN